MSPLHTCVFAEFFISSWLYSGKNLRWHIEFDFNCESVKLCIIKQSAQRPGAGVYITQCILATEDKGEADSPPASFSFYDRPTPLFSPASHFHYPL